MPLYTAKHLLDQLRERSDQSPEDRVQACIDELKRRPFNCLSGALIRFHLLRLSAIEVVLVVVSHPMVLDGHSIDLLQHEISNGYSVRHDHTRDI